jgi:hypothetical protein
MKDKALIKTLGQKTDELSDGFEAQVINHILVETEKRSQRNYHLGLLLVGTVSLVLIGSVFFILEYYFSFNIFQIFSNISRIRFVYNPLYNACFFIAVLVLLLLAIDHQFRKIIKKKMYN